MHLRAQTVYEVQEILCRISPSKEPAGKRGEPGERMSDGHHGMRYCRRIVSLAILFALAILLSDANAGDQLKSASELRRVPQLVWWTRKGLDVRHNEIDRLIDIFGFLCYHDRYSTRPCRIE